jgi:8-oxo-dGTP pyrophosphatase MutT (NUDIX family)
LERKAGSAAQNQSLCRALVNIGSAQKGATLMKAENNSKIITAAGAIIYRPSRGFLLLRNRDYWEFPKGRVDESKDSDVLATAVREIGEETGLTDVKFIEGFHEIEQYKVQRGPKDVHIYLATTSQEPVLSHEHRGYCWCYPSEVLKFLSYESKRVIFRKALAFLRVKGMLKRDEELAPGKSLKPHHNKPKAKQ